VRVILYIDNTVGVALARLADKVSISSRRSSRFHYVTRPTIVSLAVLILAVILLLQLFSATLNGCRPTTAMPSDTVALFVLGSLRRKHDML
jgi:hypothetical protein